MNKFAKVCMPAVLEVSLGSKIEYSAIRRIGDAIEKFETPPMLITPSAESETEEEKAEPGLTFQRAMVATGKSLSRSFPLLLEACL